MIPVIKFALERSEWEDEEINSTGYSIIILGIGASIEIIVGILIFVEMYKTKQSVTIDHHPRLESSRSVNQVSPFGGCQHVTIPYPTSDCPTYSELYPTQEHSTGFQMGEFSTQQNHLSVFQGVPTQSHSLQSYSTQEPQPPLFPQYGVPIQKF